MLVVERDRVRALHGSEKIVVVVVVADHHVRAHLGGRGVLATSQKTNRLAELNRGRLGHSRQLSVADNRHDGKPGGMYFDVSFVLNHRRRV